MTMGYGIDDPEYPVEWIYSEQGKPVCTKFLSYSDHAKQRKPYSPRIPKNQLKLFS